MRYGGLRHTDYSLRGRIANKTRTISSLLRHYAWMPASLTLVTAVGAGMLRYPAAADNQPGETTQPVNSVRTSGSQETPDQSSAGPDTSNRYFQQNTTHITVNGKTYDVPENGQVHDEQAADQSRTSVDISNHSSQNQGTGSNSNSTTLNVSTGSVGVSNP